MNNSKHIRIIFLLAALIAVLTIIPANAQVVELWNTTYEGSYDDTAQGVDTDSDNNVIITGTSNDGSTDNYYTIKYDSDGNEIWNATYDGGYQDVAWDVAADNGDNVTVTGFSNDSSTNNYYTIKYDQDGNEIWNATYDSGGADRARGVATDSDNNIVVTGVTYDGVTEDDIYTVKYDPNGNELWNVTYDSGFDDRGYSIATDNDNNVIVTGESGDGSTYNYFTRDVARKLTVLTVGGIATIGICILVQV